MTLQNGYKVIYEKAEGGKRTFYASKSNVYPAADDITLASFTDADYRDRVIYEYKGKFYASAAGETPKYENGVPVDECINSENFDKVFTKAENTENTEPDVDNTEPEDTVEGDGKSEPEDEPETPDEPDAPEDEPEDEPTPDDDEE